MLRTPGPDHPSGGLRLVPFRGLRYAPDRVGSLAAVTSPPYDVVVRPDGLRHLRTADPYNIVRLILPESADPTTRHRQAAETLRGWEAEGVLVRDLRPALYVYEQRRGDVLQRGLIGALRLTPPEEGVVLPHEDVMPEVVEDRAALMRETAANLEPLLLSYRGDGTATGATAVVERATAGPPLLSTTTEDGFSHRLWAVTDPDELAEADRDLSRRQALIADGHHRWATYLRLRAEHGEPGRDGAGGDFWDHGLVLLVDTARHPLRVQPIHRVLYGIPPSDALARLGGAFRVRTVDGPLPRALRALESVPGNAFLLAGDGTFRLLHAPDPALLARTVRDDRPERWRRLDATVLHSTLLGAVWRVPDRPSEIGYLHDADAAVEQAERRGGSAVLMRAVAEDTVRELARLGVTMPRKSTSFGPKPATGLVLRALEDGHRGAGTGG
ncbi:DUF1015 family protein [Streptomyces sp. TRM43335]|uniref:DUF1015 family protein n=1 Tax=Streptomyces taklimakanensis TaxID=2569853 RepID=A0A6G2B8L9_9ACTN|nr:DUF1015 domain-containing protein [Streptomyces taklimakanensis]MTE18419.1 DUF1015 family protein [Streptomyces taklimakanensis]